MESLILTNIYIAIFCYFIYKRSLIFMHLFQQEEYDNKRFIINIATNLKLIDKKLSLIIVILAFLSIFINQLIFPIISSIILIIFAIKQINPMLRNSKKPLIITSRVKKILSLYFMLIFAISFSAINIIDFYKPLILSTTIVIIIQILPYIIILSNILLLPYEIYIQKQFLNQAKDKIKKLSPKIIAITGSYGKTSTKHILNHILSFYKPTLCTPGSINTSMGITRIIREKLTKEHEYFIVEMGAYGIGSITRLCKLTKPDYSAITAIGNAHYERFKSIDNVAQAKFEISKNLNNGFCFLNNDTIDKKYIKKYSANAINIGQDNNNDYIISNIEQDISGIKFTIKINNKSHKIHCPLYGKHHAGNIAISIAIAHKLEIDIDTIISSLKSMPQINHRVEVIKNNNSPIIIDDSYNANPSGFSNALNILKLFKKDNNRAILVTPGMVELGELHDEKHRLLACEAIKIIDIAIIIKPQRVQSFMDTLKQFANPFQQILQFNDFASAKKWIDQNVTKNDVILYENDLPDLYENKISF